MSYITMEIWTGIWILVRLFPMALIIFAGVMIIEVGIEFIQKKKIEVKILNWLCQFLWILIVVSILKITGIIGGSFEYPHHLIVILVLNYLRMDLMRQLF